MIGEVDLERARRADRLFAELLELDEQAREDRRRALRDEDPALAALLDRLLVAAHQDTQDQLRSALSAGAALAEPSRMDVDERIAAGARIGAWKIVRPLARGGMSRVFVAERVEGGFRQRAALKLFERSPELAGDLVQRFE